LRGCGTGGDKSLLPAPFGKCAVDRGSSGSDMSLGSVDSGSGLLNPGQRPIDLRCLQLLLALVVFDGCSGGLYGRARLGYLRLIIVILQLDEQVPLWTA